MQQRPVQKGTLDMLGRCKKKEHDSRETNTPNTTIDEKMKTSETHPHSFPQHPHYPRKKHHPIHTTTAQRQQ